MDLAVRVVWCGTGHQELICGPGVGIMEADDCQVTIVFTVSRHSTIGTRQTEYHEVLPSSANNEVTCDCTFTYDGNASPGVALTFEKLCIANAQHGKNCVSSPAAKATISTDLPKIDKYENTNV